MDERPHNYASALSARKLGDAYGLLCGELRETTAQRDYERQVTAQLEELGSLQRTEHVISHPPPGGSERVLALPRDTLGEADRAQARARSGRLADLRDRLAAGMTRSASRSP